MSLEAAKEAAFTPRHRLRIMIQERGRMTAGCSERHITPPICQRRRRRAQQSNRPDRGEANVSRRSRSIQKNEAAN
jgi:hypothetical protein